MNKRIDLRVSQSLELLETFKKTGAIFATREEQLSRDLATHRFEINRAHHQAVTACESDFSGRIASITSHFDTKEANATAVYESRRNRIETYYNEGMRDLPGLARQTKEAWMGNLQMRDFNAQTQRTNDRKEAEAASVKSLNILSALRGYLANVEKLTAHTFVPSGLRKMLRTPIVPKVSHELVDEEALLAELQTQIEAIHEKLKPFGQFTQSFVVRFVYISLSWLILAAAAFFTLGWPVSVGLLPIFAILLFCPYPFSRTYWRFLEAHTTRVIRARQLSADCESAIHAVYEARVHAAEQSYEQVREEVTEQWNRADNIEEDFAKAVQAKLETHPARAIVKNQELYRQKLAQISTERDAQLAAIQCEAEAQKTQLAANHEAEMAQWTAESNHRWDELEADWQNQITPLYNTLDAINAIARDWFPAWTHKLAENWTMPIVFTPATQFARIEVDLAAGSLPKDPRLALPGSPQISIPLSLSFPDEGSLLFETQGAGDATVSGTLNQIILRLLSTTPPGKISFTIIDPVGLGENFAGLMQLSDYEETLINRRIWTQRDQIEERLGELCEHIEKVIQMYLRNQYATITEYNEQAGSVAEKYHFLVVADFPSAFSETAAARLQSIATSGARCGVFTLIHWDKQPSLPDGFVPDELRNNSIRVQRENGQFFLKQMESEEGVRLIFDVPPTPETALELTQKIGKASIDSNRVEVPFSQIAPTPEEMWTNDTTNELRVAIGRTGATKQQYLAIGKGTRQHALFAGKTGSGKSTLFHVIITNLALSCSPEQVEFYLIDFKKGVEFKCYAEKRLPHARVVAIESDREFALSVLERVDEELKRRGDLFRKLGVQDVAGYKREGGKEPIPRTLLIIDEFQEFFVEDDSIAQTASLLLDRIVRQGRAFGIHVLLGSQTLGGAYSLARATLGQMVIRVALQCNEADAYLIMDDNNPAPRLLSRPGEGIYNDAAGALEGNSPFQVVWLPDEERDQWLDKVHNLTEQHPGKYSTPIVFEGNAPADIAENELLNAQLAKPPSTPPPVGRAWLGAPNSIKGPTEAAFQPQSGSNLLIVGQRDEAALTMLGLSMLSLATQYPVGSAQFVLFHTATPGTPDSDFIEALLQAIPHSVTVARGSEVGDAMNSLATELKSRTGGTEAAGPVFCFIHGLQKFKKLRHEDDFSFSMSDADAGPDPGAQFNEVISEGASHGIHLILMLDTLNNVNRFLSRKALSEFEMRVVFQMSANDSASLVDSPKASTLGLHRALFYNEHEGTLETFRPYATPSLEWIRSVGDKMRKE